MSSASPWLDREDFSRLVRIVLERQLFVSRRHREPKRTRPCRWRCTASCRMWRCADLRRLKRLLVLDKRRNPAMVDVQSGRFRNRRLVLLASDNTSSKRERRGTIARVLALCWLHSMDDDRRCEFVLVAIPTSDRATTLGIDYDRSNIAALSLVESAFRFSRNEFHPDDACKLD